MSWFGAAGGLIGDIWGSIDDLWGGSNQERQAEQDRQDQKALTIQNMQMQKEFAQNGIRWRVEDAVAAGLHPLAALGASGASYSPVQYIPGDVGEDSSVGIGRGISNLGQNIDRAIAAGKTKEERQADELKLSNMRIQNDLAMEQLTSARIQNARMVGPQMPSNSQMPGLIGQGNANGPGYVHEGPLMRTHSQPGRPGQEVGAITDYTYSRTPKGYVVVPSTDVKERIEDSPMEYEWMIRNRFLPSRFLFGMPPPDPKYYALPPGYTSWKWNPLVQEFRPSKSREFRKER